MSTETEDRILKKLDEITLQRYQNGTSLARFEERLGFSETWIKDHDKAHKAVNIKLWFLVIGIPLAIIIYLLKGAL